MIVLQDEVNEKVVSLCIRGGKISAQILKASLQKLLREMEQSQKRQKISGQGQKKEAVYHGKQSMEKLKAHNQELSNIEVTDGNIRSFEKYARKYDIDYCLKKDRSAEPPKYYVWQSTGIGKRRNRRIGGRNIEQEAEKEAGVRSYDSFEKNRTGHCRTDACGG